MECTVIFQPAGCRGLVLAGKSILAAARELGAAIEAPCGGRDICGKCKVIMEDQTGVSPLTAKEQQLLSAEELSRHYRLACCTRIYQDVTVIVPPESQQHKQVVLENGTARSFKLNPAISKYYVELNKPTLADNRDDFARVKTALQSRFIQLDNNINIDYRVLCKLPDSLRQSQGKITLTLWQNREIIAIEPGAVTTAYGVAIDIGTTTLAAYLCDLSTGTVVAQASQMNSQVRCGDDVLARISYCLDNDDGLAKLQQSIITDINKLIADMAQTAGICPTDIGDMVLAGNTVMQHILLNITPRYIGSAPFVSAIREALDIKARDLGISMADGGYVHCLPSEAGFVGADNVAVLIAEQPHEQSQMTLVVDIGTNGEINFGNKAGVLSASCATGPALEGAQIKFGMRAAPGAVSAVRLNPDTKEPQITLIGEADNPAQPPPARGICGSGIIDAVAELFKAGIITKDGSFNKRLRCPRLRRDAAGKLEYVLVWAEQTALGQDITITQKDVRAVQLAKAALYTGAKMLMQKKGVTAVERIILAGAFGSCVNKENALAIGLIPACQSENVTAVGNAAGEGAKLALFDQAKRAEAQAVARWIQFVETAAEAGFQQEFLQAMFIPHACDEFPPGADALAKTASL